MNALAYVTDLVSCKRRPPARTFPPKNSLFDLLWLFCTFGLVFGNIRTSFVDLHLTFVFAGLRVSVGMVSQALWAIIRANIWETRLQLFSATDDYGNFSADWKTTEKNNANHGKKREERKRQTGEPRRTIVMGTFLAVSGGSDFYFRKIIFLLLHFYFQLAAFAWAVNLRLRP